MPKYKYLFVFLFSCCVVLCGAAFADTVTPTSEVTARVVVRAGPASSAAEVGSLRPGEQAELLGSVPKWHHVRLANGTDGFVPKRWTKVVSSGTPPVVPTAGTPSYTMDVVDVGTGLGIFVHGDDFNLIYDAGSNDDEATGEKNRMVAFIKTAQPSLHKLDHVILSHPHNDHVSLMADLFKQYDVKEAWDSGALNDMCTYHDFLAAVRDEAGVKYHTAANGPGGHDATFTSHNCAETVHLTLDTMINTDEAIHLGQGASMTFLNADGDKHSDFNRNSLVVRLDLGGTRILLMGDAPAGDRQPPSTAPGLVEKNLLTCCKPDLAAKVLVVGHHGSMTSSRHAFLDAVGASIFIVSAGPKPYGNHNVVLPDQEVISELNSRPGIVLRTDGDGDDGPCMTNPTKIGPVADGKPGGCDNIRVTIGSTGQVEAKIWHGPGQ